MASFLQPTYSGWNKAVPLTLSGLCVCVCVCACARAHVCVLLDTRALSILGWWEVGGPGRLPRRPATWRLSLGPPTCSHPADAQPSGGPGAALLSPLPRQGQGPSTPRRGCTASPHQPHLCFLQGSWWPCLVAQIPAQAEVWMPSLVCAVPTSPLPPCVGPRASSLELEQPEPSRGRPGCWSKQGWGSNPTAPASPGTEQPPCPVLSSTCVMGARMAAVSWPQGPADSRGPAQRGWCPRRPPLGWTRAREEPHSGGPCEALPRCCPILRSDPGPGGADPPQSTAWRGDVGTTFASGLSGLPASGGSWTLHKIPERTRNGAEATSERLSIPTTDS